MKPPNDEAPSGQGKGLQETHETTNAAIVSDAEAERNRFNTLVARATKAGHRLQKLGSGFILGKWGWTKHCCDLDGVEAALRQMGAVK